MVDIWQCCLAVVVAINVLGILLFLGELVECLSDVVIDLLAWLIVVKAHSGDRDVALGETSADHDLAGSIQITHLIVIYENQ